MCNAMQNSSWDPAAPLTAAVAPLSSLPCHRLEKIQRDDQRTESSSSGSGADSWDDAERLARRAASESCLLSLANFTESLSYRHGPSPPPPPRQRPSSSERKRSKTDVVVSPSRLRRRKNRRLLFAAFGGDGAAEEEFRRSLSLDDADDEDTSSSPRSEAGSADGEGDDKVGPLEMRSGPGRSSSSSSSLLHPRPHIDMGRTYATDHLMMATGMMRTIPLTPTKGMAGMGPGGFLGLGGDKCSSNSGFWVLQS